MSSAADRPPDDLAAAGPGPVSSGGGPLRVSTLELFFDLVFAFTLTQLTELLVGNLSVAGAAQVVLVFGVLWWMYGGYAWLTNNRAPDRTVQRLLLLVGMAGFLVAGLAIPHGFGPHETGSRLALGLGYLLVVVVHSALFYRVNKNILRVTPFNLAAALLTIVAAFTAGPVSYLLWALAVATLWLSPLISHPSGRFEVQPSHFAERLGALMIVALGESVAAVGISAAPAGLTFSVALSAVLGLALSAALWWVYFGDGDDGRSEQVMAATPPERRAGLALTAFYTHIPMLLGVVTLATGVSLTIGTAGRPHPVGQAIAVAGGAALFLAGDAWFRWGLHLGTPVPRLLGAVFALATTPLGAVVSAQAQLAVLLAGLVAMLAAEHHRPAWHAWRKAPAPPGDPGAGRPADRRA
jgi:low temperature requirement protein LtrA